MTILRCPQAGRPMPLPDRSPRRLSLWSGCLRACLPGCILLTGCVSDLDRKIVQVRAEAHTLSTVFVEGATLFAAKADVMATSKHDYVRTVVERDWTAWLDRHTDASGGLVSTDATGAVVPMKTTQLKAAMDQRNAALIATALEEVNWAQIHDSFVAGAGRYGGLMDMLQDKEFDWLAARESMQVTVNHILNSIGSTAAGLGLGAAVLP